MIITGNLVDIPARKIYEATIHITAGKITAITPLSNQLNPARHYLLPGFTDSHVHIESSMLVPAEFARLAVVHGTVATVSDPHEIANVCGMAGVEYMIRNGEQVPFKFNFGAPSCVPATTFETAGAAITVADVDSLLQRKDIRYLTEMMNYPGVLHSDPEVLAKIALAKRYSKPVDGHAPGLTGLDAQTYIDAGITTDHECFTAAEAEDKLRRGMKILIREGSAARNFEALIDLVETYFEHMMFCSDDKHPDSLAAGHINHLCARAVARGIDPFKVLQCACINPVQHYQLEVGLLLEGDPADLIVVDNLVNFTVLQTFIDGQLVAKNGLSLIERNTFAELPLNRFQATPISPAVLALPWNGSPEMPVIEALDGQLITKRLTATPKQENGQIVPDLANDILKIVVINRYHAAPPAVAFIKNFGLKKGAIASSVAHDSHNIVAVGCSNESIAAAVNYVIQHQGGLSLFLPEQEAAEGIPLPVAGLMTTADGYEVAEQYTLLDRKTKELLGCTLAAPFMTLSFMALLVIPELKLSDKGLFDGKAFRFI
jgi:adenine deaminase